MNTENLISEEDTVSGRDNDAGFNNFLENYTVRVTEAAARYWDNMSERERGMFSSAEEGQNIAVDACCRKRRKPCCPRPKRKYCKRPACPVKRKCCRPRCPRPRCPKPRCCKPRCPRPKPPCCPE